MRSFSSNIRDSGVRKGFDALLFEWLVQGWQRKLDPDLDLFKMLGDMLMRAEYAIPFDYTISAVAAP